MAQDCIRRLISFSGFRFRMYFGGKLTLDSERIENKVKVDYITELWREKSAVNWEQSFSEIQNTATNLKHTKQNLDLFSQTKVDKPGTVSLTETGDIERDHEN